MAVIRSGNSSDNLTIDPISKAARITIYDVAGNAVEVDLNALRVSLYDGSGVGIDVSNKGIQGNTGLAVQNLYDAGRTYITFYVSRIVSTTTESLIVMNINKGGILTTGTSYTVSAGKILRLLSFNISVTQIAGGTIVQNSKMAVRSAATVTASSPIILQCESFMPTATLQNGGNDKIDIPEGVEITAGQQIGISQLGSSATGSISCCLVGFEY